jgi:hypothetical protein
MNSPAPDSRDAAIYQFAERTGISVEDAASLWSALHRLAVTSDADLQSMARSLASVLTRADNESADTAQLPRILHFALCDLRRVDSVGVSFPKAASSPRAKVTRVRPAATHTGPEPVFEHDGSGITIFVTRGGALQVNSEFAGCVFHIGSIWARAEPVPSRGFADLAGLTYSALREEWEGGHEK